MSPLPDILHAGVMGWPVAHSLSPRLHEFWLKKYGIDGDYTAIPVKPEELAAALRALPGHNMRGVNLTVPHKEAACAIVDTLDEAARRIGAVNLVVVGEDGKLQGRNTDAYGFTHNLMSAGFRPDSGKALVLGAGGAARAIIVALLDMGFSAVTLTNRTRERAEKLAQEFATASCPIDTIEWKDAPQSLADVDLLVNATSLGMAGQPGLIFPLDKLPRTATVTDIVYAPLETGLLRAARQSGYTAIGGLGMLLHQARPCFAAFFGQDPEVTQELRDFVLADRKE